MRVGFVNWQLLLDNRMKNTRMKILSIIGKRSLTVNDFLLKRGLNTLIEVIWDYILSFTVGLFEKGGKYFKTALP